MMDKGTIMGLKLDQITLADSDHQPVTLSELLSEKRGLLILHDDLTSTSVVDICGRLRDNMKIFRSLHTEVVVVSRDTPDKLQEFKERHNLNFTMLSDREETLRSYVVSHTGEEFGGVAVLAISRKGDAHLIDTIADDSREVPLNAWLTPLMTMD